MDDLFPEVEETSPVKLKLNRAKIDRTGMRSLIPSKEDVKEALDVSNGNFRDACACFSYPDGTPVPYSTFINWVTRYDLRIYTDSVRTTIAKKCFDVLVKKALEEHDIRAIESILSKWGKYIGFEDTSKKVEVTHTNNPWKDILDYIDPQREPLTEAEVEVVC